MSRGFMTVLAVAAFVTTGLLSVTAQSADPWAGTWRLNVAKSKYSFGAPPKSQMLRLEAVANGSKTVLDTVNADGSKAHVEISAVFDGKPYEVKGAAEPTTRSYKRVDRGYEFVTRVGGKVTTVTRSVASQDGKTLTTTQTGADAQGRNVSNVLVWERQ